MKEKYERPKHIATYSEDEIIGGKSGDSFDPQWAVFFGLTIGW